MKKLITFFLLTLLLTCQLYADRGQGAKLFDNVDDKITIDIAKQANFDILNIPYAWSIAFWVVISTDTVDYSNFMIKDTSTFYIRARIITGTLRISIRMRKGAGQEATGRSLASDLSFDRSFFSENNPRKWIHFVATHSLGVNVHTGYSFFINGKPVAAEDDGDAGDPDVITSDKSPIINGGAPIGGFLMDELYFFNYVLTQQEAETLMNKGIPGESPGLVASYHFDEKSGGIFDSSGGGAHSSSIVGTTSVDGAPIRHIMGE